MIQIDSKNALREWWNLTQRWQRCSTLRWKSGVRDFPAGKRRCRVFYQKCGVRLLPISTEKMLHREWCIPSSILRRWYAKKTAIHRVMQLVDEESPWRRRRGREGRVNWQSPGKEGDILRSQWKRALTRPFTNLHNWAQKEIAVFILESFFALCRWNLPILMLYIVWIDHTCIYQPSNGVFSSQFA